MSRPQITIVLPTLNEEETIGEVIDEIHEQALEDAGYLVQVLVVDGDSTDRTIQIAQERGAEVIIEARRGKGRAMRTAFEQVKADFVFMLDADYTYPATYIPDMLGILQQSPPVVTGSRLRGKRDHGAMSRLNVVGNHLLTWMASILYWKKTSDLCTGLWGFRGEVLKELKLSADGFDFEADLFIQISRSGHSIAQVPIAYRRRPTKQKLHSLRDGFKIGWKLIRDRFIRQ